MIETQHSAGRRVGVDAVVRDVELEPSADAVRVGVKR
jgi:hypothetical protein